MSKTTALLQEVVMAIRNMHSKRKPVRTVSLAAMLGLVATGLVAGPSIAQETSQSMVAAPTAEVSRVSRGRFITGLAQVAEGFPAAGGVVTLETTKGRPIKGRRTATTIGGGFFLKAKGLPETVVVRVRLNKHVSEVPGSLRAFVKPRSKQPVRLSVGTTVQVKTWRSHKRWTKSRAAKRSLKAMGLPATTRLGFEDRLSPNFVRYRVLKKTAHGDLDRLVRRIARKAVKGKGRVKLYAGTFGSNVKPVWPPRAKTRQKNSATLQSGGGPVSTIGEIASLGLEIYNAVSANSTAAKLNQLSSQLTTVNNEVVDLQQQVAAVSAMVAGLYTAITTSDYAAGVNTWNGYDVDEAVTSLEQIAAGVCTADIDNDVQATPGNPYTAADCNANTPLTKTMVNGYHSVIKQFNTWASGLITDAANPSQTVLGSNGTSGIVQNAVSLISSLAGTGQLVGTAGNVTAGVSTTAITSPISLSVLQTLDYWQSQLLMVGVVVDNYTTELAGSGQQIAPGPALNPAVCGVYQLEASAPVQVPSGAIYDPDFKVLWYNLGWAPSNVPYYGLLQGVTWSTPQLEPGGSIFGTFASDYAAYYNSSDDLGTGYLVAPTVSAAQVAGTSLTVPLAPYSAGGVGNPEPTAYIPSVPLGAGIGAPGGPSGIQGDFPNTTWSNVWDYMAITPVLPANINDLTGMSRTLLNVPSPYTGLNDGNYAVLGWTNNNGNVNGAPGIDLYIGNQNVATDAFYGENSGGVMAYFLWQSGSTGQWTFNLKSLGSVKPGEVTPGDAGNAPTSSTPGCFPGVNQVPTGLVGSNLLPDNTATSSKSNSTALTDWSSYVPELTSD